MLVGLNRQPNRHAPALCQLVSTVSPTVSLAGEMTHPQRGVALFAVDSAYFSGCFPGGPVNFAHRFLTRMSAEHFSNLLISEAFDCV
jgi:hypothetical protein